MSLPEQPKRIQRKRTRGWKMSPNTVYVGRPTIFGNPFTLREFVSSEACVSAYRKWLMSKPELLGSVQRVLRGKDLACWCALNHSCHADVLLEIANA